MERSLGNALNAKVFSMDLKAEVPKLLLRHPIVTSVQLAGSRERGDANALSDWDFVVETDDDGALRENISHLLDPLDPLVGQWDPLGPVWCYMLILKGGVKVDFIVEGSTRRRTSLEGVGGESAGDRRPLLGLDPVAGK